MTRNVLKLTKWLSAGLVGLLLLIIIALAVILFTPPGLKVVTWAANKALPSLTIGSVEGALFPRFTVRDASFHDASLNLDVQLGEATLANDFRCLLDPKVCVHELTLRNVTVALPTLPESAPPAPDASVENAEPLVVSVPFPIVVSRVSLDNVKLDILGNQVSWQQFRTGASMIGSQLTIAETDWQQVSLKLAPTEPEPEKAPAPIVLPDVTLPLSIDLKRFDLQGFTLEQATEPLVVDHFALSAQANEHTITLHTVELSMAPVSASLNGEVTLSGDYPLDVSLDATVRQAPLSEQRIRLHAHQSVADLALDSTLSGDVRATLAATLAPLDPDLPFTAEIKNLLGQWPLTGEADYQFDVASFAANGSLKGYQLALDGQVKGKPIPDVALMLKGKGDLEQIALSQLDLKGLGGRITGSAMANWKAPINWQAVLELDNIQPGLQWPEAEGNLSGALETSGHLTEQGGWFVTVPKLDIDGLLRGYPLNVSGELTAQDRSGKGQLQLKTEQLVLAHGPNSLSVQGKLEQDWAMQVELNFPELAKSVPDLTGRLQGQLAFSGALKTPSVDLNLQVEQLDWQQQASIEQLTLQGQLAASQDPQGDLRLEAKTLRYQDRQLDTVQLFLKGTQSNQQLNVNVFSDWLTTSFGITGGLKLKPEQLWSGALEHMQLTTPQGTWSLNQSTAIQANISKGEVDVQGHCWTQADSSICLSDMNKLGKQGDVGLTVSQFNFTQIESFIPKQTQVTGQVDAKGQVKWAPNRPPFAQLSVTLPKGQVVQQLDVPITLGWQSVELNATLENNQLQANWLFDVTDNGDLSGELTLAQLDQDDPSMSGKLNLSRFNVNFLQPLVGEYSQLGADIETDLRFEGDLRHPQVFGDLQVNNLALNGEITPVDITQGQLTVKLNGYQGTLNSNIQTPDGVLKLTGTGDWQDLAAWRSQIRVFADELKVDLPPTIQVKVQPDMTIDLQPHRASVDGKINLPWGRVVIEELPTGAISVSKDQVLVNADLQPIKSSDAIPFNVETNVQISIGDDFKLSAFGLKGNLSGRLKVTQRDKGPFIVGEVNILDGTYKSFGQDLLIKEGKVLMNGPADQPYVAITAIRNPENTEDDVTAGVKVTGLASEPTITIFSEPAMPQANALSYLLRGQDIGADSGSSGDAMTSMLIGLSLAQSGQVVGDIGEAFGVQDLQLGTTGSGDDSQVTVSGYIAPGLQIKYGVGIFKPVGEFTVRYRLMKDLYIEAVSGLESALDVLYQFEFN